MTTSSSKPGVSANPAREHRWERWTLTVFQPEFLEDLSYWAETERRTAKRLLELVKAALRDPFKGIGSPEPL